MLLKKIAKKEKLHTLKLTIQIPSAGFEREDTVVSTNKELLEALAELMIDATTKTTHPDQEWKNTKKGKTCFSKVDGAYYSATILET